MMDMQICVAFVGTFINCVQAMSTYNNNNLMIYLHFIAMNTHNWFSSLNYGDNALETAVETSKSVRLL